MSKKNYRAMYNKPAETDIPEVVSFVDEVEETTDPEETNVVMTPVVDEPAPEVETGDESNCEFTIGTVSGCVRLNVREEPDAYADIICVIPAKSEVQVCLDHEFEDWYHVCTAAGQEGYCMKQFITI